MGRYRSTPESVSTAFPTTSASVASSETSASSSTAVSISSSMPVTFPASAGCCVPASTLQSAASECSQCG